MLSNVFSGKLWKLGPTSMTGMHQTHFKASYTIYLMDSPIVSHLFRRLFSHRNSQSLRSHSALPFRIRDARIVQRCHLSTQKKEDVSRRESNWQQRTDVFPQDRLHEYKRYPMVTADNLRDHRERPKRVKMLIRDFIEGTGSVSF
jgi:hypothetical protein